MFFYEVISQCWSLLSIPHALYMFNSPGVCVSSSFFHINALAFFATDTLLHFEYMAFFLVIGTLSNHLSYILVGWKDLTFAALVLVSSQIFQQLILILNPWVLTSSAYLFCNWECSIAGTNITASLVPVFLEAIPFLSHLLLFSLLSLPIHPFADSALKAYRVRQEADRDGHRPKWWNRKEREEQTGCNEAWNRFDVLKIGFVSTYWLISIH